MKPAQFPGFLLVNLLVCLLIGYLLDDWLHTTPVFLVVFVFYAMIGSVAQVRCKGQKKQG